VFASIFPATLIDSTKDIGARAYDGLLGSPVICKRIQGNEVFISVVT